MLLPPFAGVGFVEPLSTFVPGPESFADGVVCAWSRETGIATVAIAAMKIVRFMKRSWAWESGPLAETI
jgi:hypothetical protein